MTTVLIVVATIGILLSIVMLTRALMDAYRELESLDECNARLRRRIATLQGELHAIQREGKL